MPAQTALCAKIAPCRIHAYQAHIFGRRSIYKPMAGALKPKDKPDLIPGRLKLGYAVSMNYAPEMLQDGRLSPLEALTERGWDFASELCVTLEDMFGRPSRLALDGLRRAARAPFLAWLQALECLARRLLLIMAAALPNPKPAPAPAPEESAGPRRAPVRSEDGIGGYADMDSSKWPVQFRLAPPCNAFGAGNAAGLRPKAGARAGNAAADTGDGSDWDGPDWDGAESGFKLALRFEAVLRVIGDPEPYARKLARRLWAAPHKAQALALAEPSQSAKACAPALEQIEALRFEAEFAALLFHPSG